MEVNLSSKEFLNIFDKGRAEDLANAFHIIEKRFKDANYLPDIRPVNFQIFLKSYANKSESSSTVGKVINVRLCCGCDVLIEYLVSSENGMIQDNFRYDRHGELRDYTGRFLQSAIEELVKIFNEGDF